ncbi:unnamed protein product, partial [Owenia fusiformis]
MAGRKNDILQEYRVHKVQPTVYYWPEFITEQEHDYLLQQVYAAPKPKWTQLSNRRLQNWGGLPHEKGMIAEPLPQWLGSYAGKLANLGIFQEHTPNHVLVNEYQPGQGIMPHEDGPLFYPTVATISLGSHTILDFYHHRQDVEDNSTAPQLGNQSKDRLFTSLLLEPRSLVIIQDDMYKKHLHGINETTVDDITDNIANLEQCKAEVGNRLERTTRVSLTIRYFAKVLKAKLMIGNMKRSVAAIKAHLEELHPGSCFRSVSWRNRAGRGKVKNL